MIINGLYSWGIYSHKKIPPLQKKRQYFPALIFFSQFLRPLYTGALGNRLSHHGRATALLDFYDFNTLLQRDKAYC